MGVTTWDGSASTDWATAANWDTGSVPTGSTHVVIPDTSSINNCVLDQNRTVESFRIDANGTFDGDGNTLTIDNEGDATTGASEGYAVRIAGIISGTDTDIQVTTPAATNLDLNASSGNIRNLTINHASCDAQLQAAASITGNLTITAGELDTTSSDHALTVTGTTTVSNGTLTLNGSTCIFNTGATAGGLITDHTSAVVVADADSTCTFGSIALHSDGCDVRLAGTNTINKYLASTDIIINAMNNTVDAASAFTVTTPDAKGFAVQDTSVTLTITPASSIAYKLEDTMNVAALTISANASLTTLDGSSNRGLNVSGDCIVDGTLTGNASAISLGSLAVGGTYSATSGTTTITSERSNGRAVDIVGTFHHSNGTLKIQTAADTDLRWPSSSNCNDLIIDHASCIARPTGSNKPPIAGDLTINQGKFSLLDTDGSTTHPCTVTGNCVVGDGSGSANTAIFEGRDDSVTFGSLTIDSDGHYDATSGTTTIKGNASSSSNLALNIDSNATFTHNSGTILFDGTNTFGGSSYGHFYFGDKTFNDITINASGKFIQPRKSSTTTLDINGDLNITAGQLSNYNNDIIWDIAGDVDVSGTLGITDSTGAYSFASLTINSGGTYNATSGITTITSEKASTGFALKNEGTFTHNNGTIKITTGAATHIMESNFYNLTITSSAASHEITLRDSANNIITVFGDLTVESGRLCLNTTSDTMIIHGNTHVGADGTCWHDADQDTDKIIHHGLVTNLGTYKINDGTTVNLNGGIRQLGTLSID